MRSPLKRRVVALFLLCAFFLIGAATAAANPYSVFIVHCEPRNADGVHFLNLMDMMDEADAQGVKVTIDFTPQWVDMILGNPSFLAAVQGWVLNGHEIGAHHHGYGVSLVRGTAWDGYSNVDPAEMSSDYQAEYRGDMTDFMALLNSLPGTRTSGTLGLSEPEDLGDWPGSLTYSVRGHELSDVVSRPERVLYGGHWVWEMRHGLFWSATAAELQSAYDAAASDEIFAVVTHVSNFKGSEIAQQRIHDFFAFLASREPSGQRLVTVTEAMGSSRMEVPAHSLWSLIGLVMLLALTGRQNAQKARGL